MLFLDDAVVRHISRDRNWDEKSNRDKNESPPIYNIEIQTKIDGAFCCVRFHDEN